MQRCSKCATDNDDGRSFCSNCGAALWSGAPESPVTPSGTAVGVLAFFAALAGIGVDLVLSVAIFAGLQALTGRGIMSATSKVSAARALGAEVIVLVLAGVGLWAVFRTGAKRLSIPGLAFLVASLVALLGGFGLCSAITAAALFYSP